MSSKKIITLRLIFSAIFLAAAWLSPLEGTSRLVAFLAPYLIIGGDVLWRSAINISHGQIFDENFLMSLATIGAFAIGEYPEAVSVMLFYQVGELFQGIAVGRSRKSIAALMDISPDSARVLRDGKELVVSPDEVNVGETILVLPGEKVPLDGIILEGYTTLNASALTGESLPDDKAPGDDVISGCINLTGAIKVRVLREFGESTVSKILELVENSADKKARMENFISRFSRYYTPCVVTGALLLAFLPPLITGGGWSDWLSRALIFLVVSCPCALVVSVPLSFFGGIGAASRQGILIKGANYLEALSQVKTAVFDKTGTLTHGNFTVTAVHPEKLTEAQLLDIAAAAESYSNHPIAESIIVAHGGHIDKTRLGNITELSGLGVEAVIDGKNVYVGNGRLMDMVGAKWHLCHTVGTNIHVAVDSEYMGHIVVADEIKSDAAQAVTDLRTLGITKTVMLTGDLRAVGEDVGQRLGIDETYTGLLPKDKVEIVEKLLAEKQEKGFLAFLGDGTNDAPVISRADVGISMGAMGSDAAIESADVVLMDDNPSKLCRAIRISRKTMGIVHQNIVVSLSVKLLVLILGAVGVANMWLAVFADVGVLILATANAMRTLSSK